MIVEKFPENITCWGGVVFEKRVKQCQENNFLLSDHETENVLLSLSSNGVSLM